MAWDAQSSWQNDLCVHAAPGSRQVFIKRRWISIVTPVTPVFPTCSDHSTMSPLPALRRALGRTKHNCHFCCWVRPARVCHATSPPLWGEKLGLLSSLVLSASVCLGCDRIPYTLLGRDLCTLTVMETRAVEWWQPWGLLLSSLSSPLQLEPPCWEDCEQSHWEPLICLERAICEEEALLAFSKPATWLPETPWTDIFLGEEVSTTDLICWCAHLAWILLHVIPVRLWPGYTHLTWAEMWPSTTRLTK